MIIFFFADCKWNFPMSTLVVDYNFCFLFFQPIGNPEQISEANVYIQVLDVNDHAPEFPKYYETFVCENVVSGQVRVTHHFP